MLTLQNCFRAVIFMIMLTTYLPLVYYKLPPVVGSHFFYAFLFGLLLFYKYSYVFVNRVVLPVLLYGVFALFMTYFVWEYLDPWAINQLWIDYYAISVGVLIWSYFHESKDYKGFALIAKYAFIFIIVTAFLTIFTSLVIGGGARAITFRTDAASLEIQRIFRLYGSGHYASCIVFMSITSLVVYYMKHIHKFIYEYKWILYACMVLLLGAVLSLQLFTNLLFAFFVLLLSLVSAENRRVTFSIASIVLVVLVSLPTDYYVDLLYSLSHLFEGTLDEFSSKFRDLAIYVQFGSEDAIEGTNAIVQRSARFPLLMDGFFKYPIFGCSVSKMAVPIFNAETGHLYWMFKLSMMGVVNLIFFMYIFYSFLQEQTRHINKDYLYYFFVAVISVLLYGIPKVTGGREVWYFIFVVAPGLYYLPLLNENYMNKWLQTHLRRERAEQNDIEEINQDESEESPLN